MNIKHAFAVASSALLALAALSAPLSPAAAGEQVLRVGTEPAFAPFEYMDEKDKKFAGFDIDLIEAVGKAGGFKVELISLPFDGIIPAILSGTIDAAISAITITDERAKKVHFSQPYYKAGLGVLIHKDFADSVKTPADLKGHKICVQIGTSGAMYAESVEGAQVVTFNSSPETYIELGKKGCDAVVNDRPVHAYYMQTTKPDNMVLLPEFLTAENYGIMTNQNDTELAKKIDAALDKIKSDGTYEKIYSKYFAR
ncbi:MAG: basic amino acid ABC transporter substrate-binding protein [Succinivibrio sp.]|jgi:polar amino acid transport system substrate-binding protein|nr:basic amino acid ABC transporter substrate-binding protein [Succinivibrio sp.]